MDTPPDRQTGPGEPPAFVASTDAGASKLQVGVDWLGPHGSPASACVIAARGDTHIWVHYCRSEFSLSPPSMMPRAARELAHALLAAADLIEAGR